MSVKLHFEIISSMMMHNRRSGQLNKDEIEFIWKKMFEEEATIGIPGAQSITLSWFCRNRGIIDNAGRLYLAEKLRSCADAVKALPKYDDACDVYVR